jgi:hypothetical protein
VSWLPMGGGTGGWLVHSGLDSAGDELSDYQMGPKILPANLLLFVLVRFHFLKLF